MAVEIISSVLIAATAKRPASPYDLIDLATVHDELSMNSEDTSNDAFLQRAITQVSVSICNYCNRTFAVEAIQDQIFIQQDPYPYQVPGGVYPLQLSRWPLVNSAVVGFTGNTHGTNLVDGIASTDGITQGALVFAADGSIPAGTSILSVSSSSIMLSKNATSSVTKLSLNTGIQVIKTLSIGNLTTLVYGVDYTVDAARGWLLRLNSWTGASEKWEATPLNVQYRAGYAILPADLQGACLQLITKRFRAKGRDPMLVEQAQPGGVGTQRWWAGSQPGQSGAFPPEIEGILGNYRVPVIA